MTVLADPSLKQDFDILEQHFGYDCSNLGDLDEVARLIATKSKPDTEYILDGVQPWAKIYDDFLVALEILSDHDSAFLETVSSYPDDVRSAIRNTCQFLINQHTTQAQKVRTKRRLKTKEYIQQFKKNGWTFKLNECDESIYILNSTGSLERMSDAKFSVVYRTLADTGLPFRQEDTLHCIHVDALQNRFHPIMDYLNSLSWDGQSYIQQLAEFFTDEHGIFPLYLRRWMIGAVARVYHNGAQNPMLVMDGAQGIGKSFFVRWLAPEATVYYEGSIQPDSKDHEIRLMTTWIWEVKEINATFKKADIEALKSFLSIETVRVRLPYGHYDIVKPAIASFIGTVNDAEGFLNDPTGFRRFNICHIIQINWDYITKIDRSQVWAEAKAAYLAGEPWALTGDEVVIQSEINSHYYVVDPVEDALLEWFDIDPAQTQWWTTSYEIVKTLEDNYQGALKLGNSRAMAMAVARVMTKLKCKRDQRLINNKRERGYWGVCKK